MSPRTKKQLDSLKESRKEQILEAAFQLFSIKGYHHTSINDIAVKAKLSKGLLYNYFKSKEDLLNEVVLFAFKDTTEMGASLLESIENLSPEKIFEILIESYFSMLQEQEELMKLTLSLAVQVSAIPSVHDTMMQVYHILLGQIEAVFKGLNYKEYKKEAMLLGAIMDGIGIQYMLDPENFPLVEMKQMIINKYIDNENYIKK